MSYLGAKLWNDNLALLVDKIDGDFCTLKSSLKNIDDMTTKAIDFPYVYWISSILYKRRRTFITQFLHP